MEFDLQNPLATDPSLQEQYPKDYVWGKSLEPGSYYIWVQPVAKDVELQSRYRTVIPLGHEVELQIYLGPIRQEFLYRIKFGNVKPTRMLRQNPLMHTLFWTFGNESGPSSRVRKLYQDRYLFIQEWIDKKSFLAILRQQHYVNTDFINFWSR